MGLNYNNWPLTKEYIQQGLRQLLEPHLLFPVFFFLLLAMIWGIALHLSQVAKSNAEQATYTASRDLGDAYEAQAIRTLREIAQTLKWVSYTYESQQQPIRLSSLQKNGLLLPELLFTMAIADPEGHIVDSTGLPNSAYVGDQPYFLDQIDSDRLLVSLAQSRPGTGESQLYFSHRLAHADGRFAGIVMASVDISYFVSGYEQSKLGQQGVLALLGKDGVFRVRRTGNHVSSGDRVDYQALFGTAVPMGAEPILAETPWDGVQRYISVRELYDYPLAVVVGLSRREQMAAAEALERDYRSRAALASVLLLAVMAVLFRMSSQLAQSRHRERKAQSIYQAAAESSQDAFFVLYSLRDNSEEIVDFRFADANSRGLTLIHATLNSLLGDTIMQRFPACRGHGLFKILVEAASSMMPKEWEFENRESVLGARWVYCQAVPVEDSLVVIMRDISERKRAERAVWHLAHSDNLTHLPNRRLFQERLKNAVKGYRENGRTFALLFIDLNDFKKVNDTLGHGIGDALLRVVAERIKSCCRVADTVSRLGGDEFTVIAVDALMVDSVHQLCQRILDSLSKPFELEGHRVKSGASIGAALCPAHGTSVDELLDSADRAMYQAKSVGGSCYRLYQPGLELDAGNESSSS